MHFPKFSSALSHPKYALAQELDVQLMSEEMGFSIDQLMELAGLSVAEAVDTCYPGDRVSRILVIAGPGNNGGDGLVAARHLTHFGRHVTICYPTHKPTDKPLYVGLVKQCRALGIEFLSADELLAIPALSSRFDLIIDAIFGFSFKGAPRPPFDAILTAIKAPSTPPIASVDIPSGWDVEQGDVHGDGLRPDLLVSLTAPKLGCRDLRGARFHYLGGRFVPPAVRARFQLHLPAFPGAAQCVPLAMETAVRVADLRKDYKVGTLLEEDVDPSDPLAQFGRWFNDALAAGIQEPNAMTVSTITEDSGRPAARVVLLKGYDARGFVFYTNYSSRKGRELENGGHASLTFFWEPLQRQVRVEGTVERVPEVESDAYFHSRPRGSQLGAWVSPQSSVLPRGRVELEERLAALQEEYKDEGTPIPRPPHWGGFLIRPSMVEFWQGRSSRLHDRLAYTRGGEGTWVMQRLAP